MTRKLRRWAPAAAMLLAGAAVLGACQRERTAEVDTGTAEAEVSTTLPESQVSDAQLEAAAEGAAAVAETPQGTATSVVVSPPSAQTAPPAGAPPGTPVDGPTTSADTRTPPKSSY